MEGVIADIAWVRSVLPLPLGRGWVYGGPKFGSRRWVRERFPGIEYSGCPGSRSSRAIPWFLALVFDDRSLFVRSLANVDLPDDLGPHIMVI